MNFTASHTFCNKRLLYGSVALPTVWELLMELKVTHYYRLIPGHRERKRTIK